MTVSSAINMTHKAVQPMNKGEQAQGNSKSPVKASMSKNEKTVKVAISAQAKQKSSNTSGGFISTAELVKNRNNKAMGNNAEGKVGGFTTTAELVKERNNKVMNTGATLPSAFDIAKVYNQQHSAFRDKKSSSKQVGVSLKV